MNEKEFMERMKRAKSKVKDGLSATIVDMLPEDREYAIAKSNKEQRRQAVRDRIGMRVAALRKLHGWSQEELSLRAGLQRSHISRIEAGKYAVTFEVIQAIAEAFDMTVDLIDKRLADLAPLKTL